MGSSLYPVAAFGTQVLVPAAWEQVAANWLRRPRRPSRRVVNLRPRMRA
jgi:hypothetical protein